MGFHMKVPEAFRRIHICYASLFIHCSFDRFIGRAVIISNREPIRNIGHHAFRWTMNTEEWLLIG